MQSQNIESPAAMSDRDRAMTEVQEESGNACAGGRIRWSCNPRGRGSESRATKRVEIRDQGDPVPRVHNGSPLQTGQREWLTFAANPPFWTMWRYDGRPAGSLGRCSAASFGSEEERRRSGSFKAHRPKRRGMRSAANHGRQ